MKPQVPVGLIGSQFISALHAEALQHCPQARLAAVASPSPGNADRLARRFGVPRAFTDYRHLLAQREIQMVVVGVPNDLHCQVVLDAAAANTWSLKSRSASVSLTPIG
jgi:predicted dehydrogenase